MGILIKGYGKDKYKNVLSKEIHIQIMNYFEIFPSGKKN